MPGATHALVGSPFISADRLIRSPATSQRIPPLTVAGAAGSAGEGPPPRRHDTGGRLAGHRGEGRGPQGAAATSMVLACVREDVCGWGLGLSASAAAGCDAPWIGACQQRLWFEPQVSFRMGRMPKKVLGLLNCALNPSSPGAQAKDYARGDEVRDELAAAGIMIMDSPTGTTWRPGPRAQTASEAASP